MNTTDNIVEKKIAVLLSGGVDSSVVVYELARRGLKPDCFYIKIGPEEEAEWDCTSEEDLEMATAVASRYGCRLEVVDCHKEYWDRVTRYTMDKVRAGFTPNPDVMCNRLIKFGAFHEKRGRDYDLIATGHYACTETDAEGRKWLVTSPDPVKDQTDFLAQIYDWQLRKALFPIGHYVKDEVREIALREHLVTARRKDSQGICFLGKVNYNDYLRRYLGERPGDVLHRSAPRPRFRRWPVVCREEGRGAQHTVCEPRLRAAHGLPSGFSYPRLPLSHHACGHAAHNIQDTPHARISSRRARADGPRQLHRACRTAHTGRGAGSVLCGLRRTAPSLLRFGRDNGVTFT